MVKFCAPIHHIFSAPKYPILISSITISDIKVGHSIVLIILSPKGEADVLQVDVEGVSKSSRKGQWSGHLIERQGTFAFSF